MSTEEGEKPTGTTEGLIVDVNRSAIEKEQQDAITQLEIEKSKLNDQLQTTIEKLESTEGERDEKKDEWEALEKERDGLKSQLKEIADIKFGEEKAKRLKVLEDSGVPEEKIKELAERITGPKELDDLDWSITYLSEQFQKAQAEVEKATGAAGSPEEGNVPTLPEGKVPEGITYPPKPVTTPGSPPGGSVVKLPDASTKGKWEFETAREGIDTLYAEAAKGNTEAARLLDQLWARFAPTIRKTKIAFGITECPVCSGGILKDETCPYCDFDPAKYTARGGEFW